MGGTILTGYTTQLPTQHSSQIRQENHTNTSQVLESKSISVHA